MQPVTSTVTPSTNNCNSQDPAHTCGQTLAGIPRWRCPDAVWRGRDVIATVLHADCIAARFVGDIGHSVSAILVVMNVHPLGLALLVLRKAKQKI